MNLQRKHLLEKINEENMHQLGQLRITHKDSTRYNEIFNLLPLSISNMKNSVLEIMLLNRLSHENIFSQKEIKIDRRNMLVELKCNFKHDLVSLEHLMLRGYLGMKHLKFIMFQLFSLVNYFHFNGVVARNICTKNIMISESSQILFGDFSSMRLQRFENKRSLEHRLDINYAAPELSLNLNKNFFASDIWSLGCIFFEMAERRPLFRVNNSMDQLRSVFQCLGTPTRDEQLSFISNKGTIKWIKSQDYSVKKTISNWMKNNLNNFDLVDLLDKCLKVNPSERISAAQALAHPFFAELYDVEEESRCLHNHLSTLDLGKIFSSSQDKETLKSILIQELCC